MTGEANAEQVVRNIRHYWPHLVAGLRCYPEAKANVQETLDAIEAEIWSLPAPPETGGEE